MFRHKLIHCFQKGEQFGKWLIYSNVILLLLIFSLPYNSLQESFEESFRGSCVELSLQCAQNRMKRDMEDLSFVFRDAIYYYCLDMYHCLEGKRQICENVRLKEAEYVEKSQRRRVIKQCGIWNIDIKYGVPSAKFVWKNAEK